MKNTLLKKFTIISETEPDEVKQKYDQAKLADLLKDMQPALQHATKDLLQPRNEAVKNILAEAEKLN